MFDPSNYSQNLMTAANTLKQIDNQRFTGYGSINQKSKGNNEESHHEINLANIQKNK